MPHCSANHLGRWPREPFPRERANSWRIILPANAGDTRGGGLSPERSPFAVLEGKDRLQPPAWGDSGRCR